MSPPKPPPIPIIVLRLAAALHRLLQQALSGPRYREERVAVGLLAILSREPFRSELLFCDFDQDRESLWLRPVGEGADAGDPGADVGADVGADPVAGSGRPGAGAWVFKPAQEYLTLVLCRRLTLANLVMDGPTNMHLLLRLLVAHGPAVQGWPAARVARAPEPPTSAPPPDFFKHCAKTLANQVRRLGMRYGPISRARRAAHGPIRLCLPNCAAELAEELTLWDCLAVAPVPLARDLDDGLLHGLTRVLESLNKRYGLLRSCGLDPGQWSADEGLSVKRLQGLQDLRQAADWLLGSLAWRRPDCLKGLRQAAEALLARDPAGRPLTREEAFAQAFRVLQTDGKPCAGFAAWEDFAASTVGERMIHRGPRSLDEALPGGADGGTFTLVEQLAAPEWDQDPDPETGLMLTGPEAQLDRQSDLAYVLEHCPGIRNNPVLDWFVRATLFDGRLIHGAGGVLDDPGFRRLVDATARYPATDDEALLSALERDLNEAVRYCKNRLRRA